MGRRLVRLWAKVIPILPLVSAAALTWLWVVHLHADNGMPLTDYRVEQLEKTMAQMQAAHDRIMWLFVANLATTLAATVTYLLTHRRAEGPSA